MMKEGRLYARPEAANNAFVACESEGVVKLQYANPSETTLGYPSGCVGSVEY